MPVRDAARVGRFLRGLAEHRPRADDVFVASYPRSGTTWLQQILLVLSHGGEPAFTHVDDVVPWFERSLSLGVRRAADFEALASPRIFKTHLPLAWLPRGARYVYAVRDGRDVAVSYYELYRSHLGYDGDFAGFLRRFLRGRVQYGSWFKHVAGWREGAHSARVRVVEYAKLQDDLVGSMCELDEWLGFGRGRARVAELAQLCTFEHMKANEHRFDHATEARAGRGRADGRFIRQGRSGSHRALFSQAELEAFRRQAARRVRWPRVELNLPAFLH